MKKIEKYTNNDYEIAANELLNYYYKIYNGGIECSELSSILSRSKSKWAEYTIKDLCLSPKNFENIETTYINGLGKHLIPFSQILKLINICENYIPYDSRINVYTFKKSVTIQIVNYFAISWNNPYQEVVNDDFKLEKRVFDEDFLDKLSNILKNIDFTLFYRAIISF